MAPRQHLVWFDDEITWFERFPVGALRQTVPNCPGWSVVDVVNHLSFGLAVEEASATPTSERRR